MPDSVRFADELARGGLNLIGAVRPRTARRLAVRKGTRAALRGARTVLVCGSGGRAHWEAIPAAERSDPLFVHHAGQRTLRAALPHLPGPARLLEIAESSAFDLRRLAEAAGFGVVSPYLEMLIHPVFGPWVSIRGVVVSGAKLASTGPLRGFDPCRPCPRPCLDACPVDAYGRGHRFDFLRCAPHRMREREPDLPCADACRARCACVVGPEHAYSEEEHRHRHRSSLDAIAAHYRELTKE